MTLHYSIRGDDLRIITGLLMKPAEREKLFSYLNKAARMLGMKDGDTFIIDWKSDQDVEPG